MLEWIKSLDANNRVRFEDDEVVKSYRTSFTTRHLSMLKRTYQRINSQPPLGRQIREKI